MQLTERKEQVVYFGEEYGHGNYRNTLAKQFVETFTLEKPARRI